LNYIYFEYLGSCKKKLQKLALVIMIEIGDVKEPGLKGPYQARIVWRYAPPVSPLQQKL